MSKKRRVIYRVQDKDGRGPFKPGFTETWLESLEGREDLKPCFEEFGGITFTSGLNMGCGCMQPSYLKRWFTESEYKTLLEHGYKAVAMEVDSIVVSSKTQCVFHRRKPLKKDAMPFELY